MEKRQVGKVFVPAYLLVPAKGHLPSGERHENDTLGSCVFAKIAQEQTLVADMFQNVVADDKVESVLPFSECENIRSDEFARRAQLTETLLRYLDARRRHIHT